MQSLMRVTTPTHMLAHIHVVSPPPHRRRGHPTPEESRHGHPVAGVQHGPRLSHHGRCAARDGVGRRQRDPRGCCIWGWAWPILAESRLRVQREKGCIEPFGGFFGPKCSTAGCYAGSWSQIMPRTDVCPVGIHVFRAAVFSWAAIFSWALSQLPFPPRTAPIHA